MHGNKNVLASQGELKLKAEQLKKAYQKLSAAPYTAKYQREYFESFPNSFVLFNNLFGYSSQASIGKGFNPGPLYNEAQSYVNSFFNLNLIDTVEYYNRIIDIGINGKWYADGVNYFKNGMELKIKKDIDVFVKLLSKRSDSEVKSFWFFYFDGPHPSNAIPSEFDGIITTSPKMYSIIEMAHKEVLK
ncbi:MAG: hypothetical protein EPN85_01960 [Bacteroidetes bacterium]|nr:MAG: hypothetical protein EPN85_01960 [Bacteroidota bacterium]